MNKDSYNVTYNLYGLIPFLYKNDIYTCTEHF